MSPYTRDADGFSYDAETVGTFPDGVKSPLRLELGDQEAKRLATRAL